MVDSEASAAIVHVAAPTIISDSSPTPPFFAAFSSFSGVENFLWGSSQTPAFTSEGMAEDYFATRDSQQVAQGMSPERSVLRFKGDHCTFKRQKPKRRIASAKLHNHAPDSAMLLSLSYKKSPLRRACV